MPSVLGVRPPGVSSLACSRLRTPCLGPSSPSSACWTIRSLPKRLVLTALRQRARSAPGPLVSPAPPPPPPSVRCRQCTSSCGRAPLRTSRAGICLPGTAAPGAGGRLAGERTEHTRPLGGRRRAEAEEHGRVPREALHAPRRAVAAGAASALPRRWPARGCFTLTVSCDSLRTPARGRAEAPACHTDAALMPMKHPLTTQRGKSRALEPRDVERSCSKQARYHLSAHQAFACAALTGPAPLAHT